MKKYIANRLKSRVPFEAAQDQAQNQLLSLDEQLERLDRLKKLPPSAAVQMQINDMQRSIDKTMDYMRRTGQSINFSQQEDDALLRQAQLIQARQIVEQHGQPHKLIDLLNERQINQDRVNEVLRNELYRDMASSQKPGYSEREKEYNKRALVKLAQNMQRSDQEIIDDPAPPLINYTPIGSLHYKYDLIDSEIQQKRGANFTEEMRVKENTVPKVQSLGEAMDQEIQADAFVKQPNIYEEGEMRRYLRDNNYLNGFGKVKNKFIYSHLERTLVKKEKDKEKKKIVSDLLRGFHKKGPEQVAKGM